MLLENAIWENWVVASGAKKGSVHKLLSIANMRFDMSKNGYESCGNCFVASTKIHRTVDATAYLTEDKQRDKSGMQPLNGGCTSNCLYRLNSAKVPA